MTEIGIKKLTSKQEAFIQEYLIDLNGTQAAIRAGYSPDTAAEQASRLLNNVKILDAIAAGKFNREQRTQVTQDMVLSELAKIAFSGTDTFVRVVEEEECIGCELGHDGNPDQSKPIIAKKTKVEVVPTDRIPPEQRSVVSEIRQTRAGISVKLHDKVKSLELLGKHLGMFIDRTRLEGDDNSPMMVTFNISRPKREDNPSDSDCGQELTDPQPRQLLKP